MSAPPVAPGDAPRGDIPLSDIPLGDVLRAAVADPARISERTVDRWALAHDASHYSLLPRAVATPAGAADVAALLAACTRARVPLTFRSGGTSLSGQASTDGVLADVRSAFREVEVLDAGSRVRVQPGVTVRQVNARLARWGRKLGPDPASEAAATIGGVIANNSSGMACGTAQNSYATLESLVLVLTSGTVVDTGSPDADRRLRALEPELHAGLLALRDRVRGDPDSVRRIRALFARKNTMGYGVNAFLDHDSAVELLAHLVVGSEGTLAFVAEVVYRTVPLLSLAQTGLLVFADLRAATASLPALVATGAATVELMDATSLRVAQRDPQADDLVRAIDVAEHTALLVEYQAADPEELAALARAARPVLADLPLTAGAALTADPAVRAGLWHLRKGLYATVAGARAPGTTALLEDVVVAVDRLLPTCTALTELFARHRYPDSVVFGHAKDGNLHFMITEDLSPGGDLQRYHRFTEDVVDLVLGEGGSLKAEHGTGRMMAPFVRRQYGDELYEVMRALKRLLDPAGVLNPGVIIDDDPQAHVRHLKHAPRVEAEVDRCVDCGYCEPVCPSKDLTTTPRQRIGLRRALARAREAGDAATVADLEAAERHEVVDTCAVDGMCQTACPVLINTGDLVRRLRAESAGPLARTAWSAAARHWDGATALGSLGMTAAGAVPAVLPETATRVARRVLGDEAVPRWSDDLPRGGPRRSGAPAAVTSPAALGPGTSERSPGSPVAVLFAACVGTLFGPEEGAHGRGVGAAQALRLLCERAGVELAPVPGAASLCCGTPWKSKGMLEGHAEMRRRVLPALAAAARDVDLPVVCDASSCTEGLLELLHPTDGDGAPAVRVLDAVSFVVEHVVDRLPPARRLGTVVVHPTCSSTRLGTTAALVALVGRFADEVVVPSSWGCCAFAGDRGLLHPELTASATARQAAEVHEIAADAHVSSNRTCEIGMTRATGRDYRHVLEVLEELTR